MKKMLLLMAGLPIVGCGIAAKVEARHDMQRAKDAYTQCLAEHADNVHACDAARLTYEADMEAYRATSGGIQPGTNSTINVNSGGN